MNDEDFFVSLDVTALYPSIPVDRALKVINDLLIVHQHLLSDFPFSIDLVINVMTYFLNHYTVTFGNKAYLQVNGVAIGSHSGGIIADLYLHHIETEVLQQYPKHLTFVRYADDCFLGPVQSRDQVSILLEKFNNFDEKIKYTVEYPDANNNLNFLDVKINVTKGKLTYCHYIKEVHSGCFLHANSAHPNAIKKNAIMNYVKVINRNSADPTRAKNAKKHFYSILSENGYTDEQILNYTHLTGSSHLMKNKQARSQCVKIPYINEASYGYTRRLIERQFPSARVVPQMGRSIERHFMIYNYTDSSCKKSGCTYCHL